MQASEDGDTLLVVNSFTGELYRVNAATGSTVPIDLGGKTVQAGDGLVRAMRVCGIRSRILSLYDEFTCIVVAMGGEGRMEGVQSVSWCPMVLCGKEVVTGTSSSVGRCRTFCVLDSMVEC